MKEKIRNVINSRYFNSIFIIILNIIFFTICNLLFNLHYETLDDFMIMKIISKLDGSYNVFSIHVHPFLSFIIMLLFKTGININWYTICLLTIQFTAFTVIEIILINKNKKIGFLSYIFITSTIYSDTLLIINYTSIASISILAGVISIMYYNDTNSKKYNIIGIGLIIIGTMLRWKSVIIVIPFFAVYSIYYSIKEKNNKLIKKFIFTLGIIFVIVVSHLITYKINTVYNNYTKFDNVRTYLFDFNILEYEKSKETFENSGWTENDWKVFYTYSFADENFYNVENLNTLKSNIENNAGTIINKILDTFNSLLLNINQYRIHFIGILILILISCILGSKKSIIFYIVLTHILINYILCYTKPIYRVIISLYSTTFVMILYLLSNKLNKHSKHNLINKIILIYTFLLYSMLNIIDTYQNNFYNIENYKVVREIVDYTSSNKHNAYVYPNVLGNVSLAYSVYEKIPDDTFVNLRHMGDWDIYNQEYYEFKEIYQIDNIMEDLFKKDNIYIITGDVYGADNNKYINHIKNIQEYISEHYDENVEYKVVKEFTDSIKVYKLYVN